MKKVKFKKGAASFYVVAFSTLILLIIVASFTALVVAQITRSSNADLAQSAYDSALAGVEDAKLAYYSYRTCLEIGETDERQPTAGDSIGCKEINYLIKHEDSCDQVSYILGRLPYGVTQNGEGEEVVEGGGVAIEESNTNNMEQAYTCVKINTDMDDYRATLSADEQMKVIRPKFDTVHAKDIGGVKISWGINTANQTLTLSELNPVFPSVANIANVLNPPVISVTILQAGQAFNLSDFDKVVENENEMKTDRGTVFLVPHSSGEEMKDGDYEYIGGEKNNVVAVSKLVKSNDRTSENLPLVVDCNTESEGFLCTATIQLPQPISGERSDDNFVVAVALPYGKPATDISVEFCDDPSCTIESSADGSSSTVKILNQIGVDSTGRANDLFRRVETRLEVKDDSTISTMGPLELFGEDQTSGGGGGSGSTEGGGGDALKKDLSVTCEWTEAFGGKTCQE